MSKKATSSKRERDPAATRQRLIDATVRLMLQQGFSGTSVDQICKEAGMTKGGFFHHFENKEALGTAAVEWWGQMGTALYAEAWKDTALDPLDQLRRMFDIMIGFTRRPDEAACVCMVGMMSQEMSATNPAFQAACEKELNLWTTNVARMLTAAKKLHKPETKFDPVQVAWFLNSLWQGSMLVGKTCRSQELIRHNIKLARAYVEGLFQTN
ncbi:MAG: TetR/AcrR family transcriptional regulator [Prosthecobacter sp.]|uniref:TetR/AcrR family transcriptional regulator n=1 Tax=Prosthecobacter sp. TaxID=1965333 RepID=UPI0025DE8810|nr:TetR/AcrR family transcriptional regulator [Prosthecobacter sp.]MCF7786570.1 TetR/AcrR family transcriptional regulator [Prosthecobacter sp.]